MQKTAMAFVIAGVTALVAVAIAVRIPAVARAVGLPPVNSGG